MVDVVLTNKVAAIEHSLHRIEEEYGGDQGNLYQNVTRQDSIVLNLQRACQSAIDVAMHLVQIHGLGVPQESRDARVQGLSHPSEGTIHRGAEPHRMRQRAAYSWTST